MEMMRNFTAVLPVTCNADCSFCPEKEMDKKASPKVWADGLIEKIKERKNFDHVSISGGEPTLRMKWMFEVIDRIQNETRIERVGLTTNGRFLDKMDETLKFIQLNTNNELQSKLAFVNVSMHSFDKKLCNKIMKTESTYTLEDLVRFRKLLGPTVSFHINFVITKQNIKNIEWEFQQAYDLMENNPRMEVVFRIDYNMPQLFKAIHKTAGVKGTKASKEDEIPEVLRLFQLYFGKSRIKSAEKFAVDSCPSCYTQKGVTINGGRAWLKASAYEPNKMEGKPTEYVYHMDGKLYYDWSRQEPVPAKVVRNKVQVEKVERVVAKSAIKSNAKVLPKKKPVKKKRKSSDGSKCSFGGTSSCGY